MCPQQNLSRRFAIVGFVLFRWFELLFKKKKTLVRFLCEWLLFQGVIRDKFPLLLPINFFCSIKIQPWKSFHGPSTWSSSEEYPRNSSKSFSPLPMEKRKWSSMVMSLLDKQQRPFCIIWFAVEATWPSKGPLVSLTQHVFKFLGLSDVHSICSPSIRSALNCCLNRGAQPETTFLTMISRIQPWLSDFKLRKQDLACEGWRSEWYSKKESCHPVRYQFVVSHDRIIRHVCGPFSLKEHDSSCLRMEHKALLRKFPRGDVALADLHRFNLLFNKYRCTSRSSQTSIHTYLPFKLSHQTLYQMSTYCSIWVTSNCIPSPFRLTTGNHISDVHTLINSHSIISIEQTWCQYVWWFKGYLGTLSVEKKKYLGIKQLGNKCGSSGSPVRWRRYFEPTDQTFLLSVKVESYYLIWNRILSRLPHPIVWCESVKKRSVSWALTTTRWHSLLFFNDVVCYSCMKKIWEESLITNFESIPEITHVIHTRLQRSLFLFLVIVYCQTIGNKTVVSLFLVIIDYLSVKAQFHLR